MIVELLLSDAGKLLAGLMLPLLGTTLGAGTVFFLKRELQPAVQKTLLGFAAGVMIALLINVYHAPDPSLSSMIDGGGIMSMVRVALIITISSSYSGIFEETGLLNGLKSKMGTLSRRFSVFGTILGTAAAAGMVACNQTLATMLVDQICKELEPDAQKFAIDMENSVIVVAPLVPWSIAGAVPLASVSAPLTSIVAAVFLYLLPLWYFGVRLRKK